MGYSAWAGSCCFNHADRNCKKFLSMGMSVVDVSSGTGLPYEEVEALKKSI